MIAGLALQFALGVASLKLPLFQHALMALNGGLLVIERATQAVTSFVFGYLGGAP